jgi:protein-tyrosine phosphatase
MGFVDIHNHLLWGIDDGCRSPEEALEAARALEAVGYAEAAPSPHARGDFPSADAALCRSRLAEARALFSGAGLSLKLHTGSENFLDESFFDRLARGESRAIGEAGRYALVELPFTSAVPKLPDLVFRVRLKGLTPIFAHPERCAEFARPGRAEEVVRLGAALQLDMGALLGRYGREERRVAERLLGEGLYAVASTDLHRPADARRWIAEALSALEKRAGGDGLLRLCQENPRRAIAGEDLS